MKKYHSFQQVSTALRKVLATKTNPDVVQAILDDLFDELNPAPKESV